MDDSKDARVLGTSTFFIGDEKLHFSNNILCKTLLELKWKNFFETF